MQVTDFDHNRLKLSFGYNPTLIAEVKAMSGSRWNPEGKFWTVTNNQRNRFALDFLSGKPVFAPYDRELVSFTARRKETAPHQINMVRHMLTRQGSIIAAEMGCVCQHTLVNANGQIVQIREVEPGDYVLSENGQTKVRGVLNKGKKDTIALCFHSGNRLCLTADHEISTINLGWVPAGNLRAGDRVCTLQGCDVLRSIEPGGQRIVYDLICTDPDRTFYGNGFLVHNCGKSLAAIELLEYLTPPDCWYVAPRVALLSVRMEFAKWKATYTPRFMTYEELVKIVKTRGLKAPKVLILDEGSKAKNAKSQRAQASQHTADAIRDRYPDWNVHILSGTPAPKSPADWWSLCEIVRPGFLKEGTPDKFLDRMALRIREVGDSGVVFPRLKTWRDNPKKCYRCGEFADHPIHAMDDNFKAMTNTSGTEVHDWQESKDELALFHRRTKNLVMRIKIDDVWENLPEYNMQRIKLAPSPYIKKLAKLIARTARTPAQARILLRELSDGFQYVETPVPCPTHADAGCDCEYDRTVRTLTRIDTPKDDALRELLESHEDDGRLIVFGAFQASVDRITEVTGKEKWDVIQRDGRGWQCSWGETDPATMLRTFQREIDHSDRKICFVGHPKSVGMGITLTGSRTSIYYGNTDDGEDRRQSMARIRRPSSRGCNIIDLCHLGVDEAILEAHEMKKNLEQLTLGDITRDLED